MIKRKKKICNVCEVPSYLFSKGLCKPCWQKIYGQAIPPISEKRKERQHQYQWLRDIYFKEHPRCERCGSKEHLDLHHRRGRDGENMFKDYMTCCRTCHEYIHQNVLEAYQKGWLLSRLTKWGEDEQQE